MSDTTTHGIRILVRPHYVADQSNPEAGRYLFAYHIVIQNHGDATVQLLRRHWIITDGGGEVDEVEGPGVVGHTPVLSPGQQFEYSSACPLSTPVGTMHGTYRMVDKDSGKEFDAVIKPFRLAVPNALN